MKSAILASVLCCLLVLVGCGGGGSQNPAPPPPPALSSIQVTGQSVNLIAGQSEQLKAMGSYSGGTTQDLTSSSTWNSSDASVATVTSGGMLSAKASGSCSITAKTGSVSGSFSLNVAPALVSIAVTPATVSIAPGTTQQFMATGTYSDNSSQNLTSSVNWSSSNIGAVTISTAFPTAGLAKTIAPGSATITATSGSVSGIASLVVTSATATSIVVTPVNESLPLGLTQQYAANATFSDGSAQDVTSVATWQSSSTQIASITTSGLATAKNVGATNISATFGSATNSTPLTVNAANLNSISIKPSNGSIAQGTRIQLAAIGTFNDGGTRDITHQVAWSSSDPTIANVGAANGFLSGIAPGLVNITASLGSATDTVPLNVSAAKIVSISLTPSLATVPISGHVHFTATGVFDDSSTQDISMSSAWTSSNTAVATVGSTSGSYGSATGVSAGSANISASFSYAGASAKGSAPLTVSSATLSSISLTPTSGLVAPGSSLQFTATATFSDGSKQTINSSATWSSSNTSVATVSTAGVAIGQSAGTVTITAQSGALSATASMVVESSTLSSIQVTPQLSSIPATIQTQFKAIGTFANGDTQDLTSAVTWTSSSSSVATISNAGGSIGIATGVAPGTVTITAVFAGQVGTASLTVTNATLTSVAVTPATASINVGSSQQFTAKGTFSDGSTAGITGQVVWNSSSAAVATIASNGVASGVSAGTATVTAALNGVTGTATLTVQ